MRLPQRLIGISPRCRVAAKQGVASERLTARIVPPTLPAANASGRALTAAELIKIRKSAPTCLIWYEYRTPSGLFTSSRDKVSCAKKLGGNSINNVRRWFVSDLSEKFSC